MTEILVCNGVKKSFDGKTEVLKGVDLVVRKGDFISILGASGSGKSTLLTILGGMDAPTEGKVMFEGKVLSELKEKELAKLRRTKVGFVFQFFNLAPYLTVEENIFLPLVLDGKNPTKYREKFTFLTDYLKITPLIKKMPSELSGGEQQRTAIARALIYEPDIIFLDEPTGNLDSGSAEDIMKLLQSINKDTSTTILQVTHSEQNALCGNRLIRIKDGLIVSEEIIKETADLFEGENENSSETAGSDIEEAEKSEADVSDDAVAEKETSSDTQESDKKEEEVSSEPGEESVPTQEIPEEKE